MSTFAGKTALISGGAEGIGFAIAKAMGQQGMNVVLGDIDAGQLAKAEETLTQEGIEVLTVLMDVTDPAQWQQFGAAALERFGKVHMLVNNAGVGGTPGPIEKTDVKDWAWVLDVNLMGVVHGAHAIVPLIKEHGEGGWMINVASMAGMTGIPYAGAYTATKMAVVGMSESWRLELAPANIEVSVLCPAFVRTRINLSTRNKQSSYKSDNAGSESKETSAQNSAMAKHMSDVVNAGLAPDLVGQRVVEAVKAKELYIFTHPNYRSVPQNRFKAMDEAFARAEGSELLADVLHQEMDRFI